jgi:site-specific DNA recombinase
MSWVRDALTQSHVDERQEHEAAIGRLQAEYDRLQNRIDDAYVDKLDGRIDAAFFDRMSADWRRDQEADQSYLEEGVQLLELARNAQRLFAKQEAKEKRRLLGFLVSNCSWKGGELTAELRQPFDLLEKTIATAQTKKATEPSIGSFKRAPAAQRSEPRERSDLEWLPFVDTYRTLCAAPDSVFRKVLLEAR